MNGLFVFHEAARRDPEVDRWMDAQANVLGAVARRWFNVMRQCGDDVRELMHDGHPTACAGAVAFAYVNVFRSHVNVGFFRGAELADPARLLTGTGKLMRHVKVAPGEPMDDAALTTLIESAYAHMRARLPRR